jgi:D-glycero-D-manno-heptose 1,7-bisphosphate phosphatase
VPALATLREKGYALVVVTNQRGVARGFMREEDVAAIHGKLRDACAAGGAPLEGVYHCPHDRDTGCPCRKPEPGMILRAAEDLGLDLQRSLLVGDSESDIEAARRAGVPLRILVDSDSDWRDRLADVPVVGRG